MYVTCLFILEKRETFYVSTRSEKKNGNSEVEVKSAYEPSSSSGQRLSQFL